MKRYEIEMCDGWIREEESETGEYVRYTDAQATVEELVEMVKEAWVEGYCAAVGTPSQKKLRVIRKCAADSITYLQAQLCACISGASPDILTKEAK